MTVFVDASALVAIVTEELERDAFLATLLAEPIILWSPMSCWETVLAVSRSTETAISAASSKVQSIAQYFKFSLVPIGEAELRMALDAYEQYGKGRHPARLNMGDCFAYACAKANNARLVYKGDDFSRTDLA